MDLTNQSIDSSKYLYVLTPSVSYRKLPSGIKFYFHYCTRADREMLSQRKQKMLTVGLLGLLFIPMCWYGYNSPAWPVILGAILLWLSWMMQMGWQRFLKINGMETLHVTSQKVEMVRSVNWANQRWILFRNVIEGHTSFKVLNQSLKQQMIFGIEPFQVIKILHPSPSSSTPEIGLKVSEEDFQKILPLIQEVMH